MIDIRRMDLIKEVFQDLSKNRQLLRTEINDNNDGNERSIVYLNYDFSLSEKLKIELSNLIHYFQMYRRALGEHDRLAALFMITCAGDLARTLSAVFGGIEDAIDKVMYRDLRFSWPSVPEGYKIPQPLLVAAKDKLKCMADFGSTADHDVLMFWESSGGKIEVVKKDSVDVIRKTFIESAESIGVSRKEMNESMDENDHFEWCIDYRHCLGEQLEVDLDELLLFLEAHRIAIQQNDLLAAYITLLYCGIHAQNVSGFFLNIKDEVDRVAVLDKRFSWPCIPDGYELPKHFGLSPHS
ncbi:hypothetical protein [Herbaspirillum sp. CAH-3]|uniref:hypothetical protein n=1 Tax=Herbaspirillum sp. CAH-3 TaxID=2605746 RepID=UPI001E5F92F4|nr:hypothetical protein [Herbaspirillum sp. CAH-3]